MGDRGFSRGQTQVLFRHLPEAVFEHDDYGLCKVTQVALGDTEVNREALFNAMVDALAMWSTPGFAAKFPDPRDPAKRSNYAVGSPREVRFSPYPQTFICRSCARTARFADLVRRGSATSGRCVACGGAINRLRYVQAHNCGRLEELFVPLQGCPKGHGPEHLAFYDPGRVKQARWYCGLCGTDIQALRMTPCKCAYNDSLPHGRQPEKFMKVVPTGDPSLYVPHTVAFINFPEETEERLKSAPDALALMLARTWGLLDATVGETLRERANLGTGGADNQTLVEMVEALRKLDPQHKSVLEYDAHKRRPRGQGAIDRVARLLEGHESPLVGAPRRWLIEHTTLLDKTSISTTADVAAMLRRRGDQAGALDIEAGLQKARGLLGIREVRVVNDFPLALCAFGYTRTSRDPGRTVITPFPVDERGKIPIFALSSETEALWFQLDPLRVVEWLVVNGLAEAPGPYDADEAWVWLYRNVQGLQEAPYEPAYQQREASAIRTLLHTMSHAFLRRIEWSGFSPSSIGEYLIPGSLSFILYANRYAETKIGGLTTLFEQRLNTWLWNAVQAGHECVYDPICSDEGGSCAGCTYREHNCVSFNRELSRATIYGGVTPPLSNLDGMTIRQGFWHQAWQATPSM
jgi:hypothetical protein